MNKIKLTLFSIFLVITTLSAGYYIGIYLPNKDNRNLYEELRLKYNKKDDTVNPQEECRDDAKRWADEMTLIINRSDGSDFRNEKTPVESYYNNKYNTCLLHYEHRRIVGTVGVDEEVLSFGYGIYDITNKIPVIYIEPGDDEREFEVMKEQLFN